MVICGKLRSFILFTPQKKFKYILVVLMGSLEKIGSQRVLMRSF